MIKKYHVSKNLIRVNDFTATTEPISQDGMLWSGNLDVGTYTFSINQINSVTGSTRNTIHVKIGDTNYYENPTTNYHNNSGRHSYTFTVSDSLETVKIYYWTNNISNNLSFNEGMLNTGETAEPYEPYDTEVWHTIPYRKYGTETDTLTSLPADVIADGQSATANIIGNMNQQGTPSPSSIIMPDECGDKTANLFDKDNISKKPNAASYSVNGNTIIMEGNSSATYYYYNNIALDAGTYSISFISNGTNCYFILGSQFDLTNAKIDNRSLVMSQGVANNLGVSYAGYLGTSKTTFTIYSDVPFILAIAPTLSNYTVSNLMLNTGSTDLPYQPYGYKIPISSGGTTTNVYLGEVQSTRKIKKLVLTGQEDWSFLSANMFRITINGYLRENNIIIGICSHLKNGTATPVAPSPSADEIRFLVSESGNNYVYFTPNNMPNLSDWTTYLSSQYSAGTPVTVWYVLATPQTTILNEPIRKIGDYADSISASNLPTTGTAEQFDVDTTLKPSEVSLTYHGWHEHSDTKFTT